MDEVEFHQAYQAAINAAERVTAPETKKTIVLLLQLLNALHERVVEIEDAAEL